MQPDTFSFLYSSEQTRHLDHETISGFGYPGFTLMELAARGAADGISNRVGSHKAGLYLCGKGNNAGDALAVARWLNQNQNHSCHIHFLFGDENLTKDTALNLHLLKELSSTGEAIQFTSGSAIDFSLNDSYHYVVDGILGTGVVGTLREPLPMIIQQINRMSIPIFAMDLPTGLHPDSGLTNTSAIRASVTFTFGTNKTGFYLNNASNYTGEIEWIPLPFPRHLYRRERARLLTPGVDEPNDIVRSDSLHKYDQGVVHILAGSTGMTGAAIMASMSAWKSGAGAVLLYSPKKLTPVYETTLPQIIKVETGEAEDTCLVESHYEVIAETIKKKPGCLLAGPGLGQNPSTLRLLKRLIDEHEGPVLLDADGIAVFSSLESKYNKPNRDIILTPHPGEAATLLGTRFSNDYDRLLKAEKFASSNNVTLISKGNPTIITSPDSAPYITGYNTTPFTRAGFGDILAGQTATFLAISNNPVQAACLALLSGYKKYQHHTTDRPFSPEHLL